MPDRTTPTVKEARKKVIRPADQDSLLEEISDGMDQHFAHLGLMQGLEKEVQEATLYSAMKKMANAEPPLYSNVYLFQLRFSSRKQETLLYGTFSTDNSHFAFFHLKDEMWESDVPCRKFMHGVQAVISYLSEKKTLVLLKGFWGDGIFYVTEMHIDSGAAMLGDKFGDSSLQAIITRLVYQTYPDRVDRAYRQAIFSAGETNLKILYAALRPTLLPQQRMWVEHSLSLLSSNISRDEKGHTMRAIASVLSINWAPRPPKLPTLGAIKHQLDQEFYGLESVKTRVLEIAAQVRRTGTFPHWGVLLNGPAGVGKTTIAKAIADIMGMPLVVLDLSTTNDSEGLTGSSRMYTNARPGAILEKLMAVRDTNCVFLLNELDKVAGGKDRGNPADTLLTLVDKLGFIDNFLETSIDTSNIFFIATCNDIDRISRPLQDRFLRIDIPRYTREEKKVIFMRHVLPRALRATNIAEGEIRVTDGFVDSLCRFYAIEPGVRDLEQYAERMVGDFLFQNESTGVLQKVYTQADLVGLLGAKPIVQQTLLVGAGIAKSIFLADERASVALVQAAKGPGSGNLQIIGVSTEFHKDCCRVAYECAKRLSSIDFSAMDITLYVPSMLPATSENSIGCAAFMAIMSAITGKEIPNSSVFLGGCDLFGNILWGGNDITPIIERMEQGGESCLYGPTSLADMPMSSDAVRIIQSYNVAALFEIADFTI